jgi:hypothetical protein
MPPSGLLDSSSVSSGEFLAWTVDLLRQVAEELAVRPWPAGPQVRLDGVWNWVDERFRAGDFARVDSVLADIDCDATDSDELLAWAVVASAARSRLPAYAPFLDRLAARLRRNGEDPDDLLQGLRP